MSSDTKARLTVVENILRVPANGKQLSVCDRLGAVSAETAVVRNDLAEQRELVLNHVEELAVALDAQNQVARETQRQLETKIALLKRTMNGLPREGEVANKVKVPESKPFNGAKNAKDLENFLWDMEQYFRAARMPNQEMVTITSMYLSGDAKLWWKIRVEDDADTSRGKIDLWEALKKELKDQFLPTNIA